MYVPGIVERTGADRNCCQTTASESTLHRRDGRGDQVTPKLGQRCKRCLYSSFIFGYIAVGRKHCGVPDGYPRTQSAKPPAVTT